MIAVELVIKIFVCMVVGFILYKIKLLNDDLNAGISRIIVEVIVPFMIFANIISISGRDVVAKSDVYSVLIIGVIIYAVLIPLSIFIVKLLRTPKHAAPVFQCMILFGNVGFLGLPIAESLYGAPGVFFMALLNIHFNLVCFTYGIWLITKDLEKANRGSNSLLKSILNPGIISLLVALALFLLDIRIPDLVVSPLTFVGSITSPLSMIILGSSIAAQSLKTIFTQWRLYALTAIRMIIFPIIAFFLMKLIIGPGIVTSIVTFYLGTPAAVIISMFAMAYGGDKETATSGIAMMNIFCVITIPCLYLMTAYL